MRVSSKAVRLAQILLVGAALTWGTLYLLESKNLAARWSVLDANGIMRHIKPLDGSKTLRAGEVELNGQSGEFLQCWSSESPRRVVEKYFKEFSDDNILSDAVRQFIAKKKKLTNCERMLTDSAGFLRVHEKNYSMLGFIDSKGYHVGVVAYNDPSTGGSFYFISRLPREQKMVSPNDDAPGADVPEVPRISSARRVFSLAKKDRGCFTGIYEYNGAMRAIDGELKSRMAEGGWEYRQNESRELSKQADPDGIYVFRKGDAVCNVSVHKYEDRPGASLIVSRQPLIGEFLGGK